MKIHNVSIFFMMSILLQAHLAFSMHSEEIAEKEKKKSEQETPEYVEEYSSPFINALVGVIAGNFYFRHKESGFESIIVQVNPHDESNKFSVIALDAWKPAKNYTKNTGLSEHFQATQIISIPFAKIAQHMNLQGASASHLKVYRNKDRAFFTVRSEKYNKEAIVAVISLNDKSPKKANL